MKVSYSAPLTCEQEKIVYDISKKCGVMQDTARILLCRKIDSVEKAERFLNPGKHNFNDPFLLSGMSEAVERLKIARQNQEKVLVFGDYDADGVCATTVLYNCLKDFGINNVCFVTPERDEGYGLSVEKINTFNQDGKLSLVISVDCGISEYENNTNSSIREEVFAKFIKNNLDNNVNYNNAKKACAVAAANALAKELNDNLNDQAETVLMRIMSNCYLI